MRIRDPLRDEGPLPGAKDPLSQLNLVRLLCLDVVCILMYRIQDFTTGIYLSCHPLVSSPGILLVSGAPQWQVSSIHHHQINIRSTIFQIILIIFFSVTHSLASFTITLNLTLSFFVCIKNQLKIILLECI